MANQLLIEPKTIYDEGAISLALDIPLDTLNKARRDGSLRYTRKGRRVFFLGQWLLDWFTDQDPKQAARVAQGKEACHAG